MQFTVSYHKGHASFRMLYVYFHTRNHATLPHIIVLYRMFQAQLELCLVDEYVFCVAWGYLTLTLTMVKLDQYSFSADRTNELSHCCWNSPLHIKHDSIHPIYIFIIKNSKSIPFKSWCIFLYLKFSKKRGKMQKLFITKIGEERLYLIFDLKSFKM